VKDFDKRVDPNATIQLDAIDALDLVKLEEEAEARKESNRPPVSRRTAPPPLPPSSLAPSSLAPSTSPPAAGTTIPPARKSTLPPPARSAALGVVFLVLLGVAIFGGLFAGRLLRGAPAPQASATAEPPATPASPNAGAAAPSASASPLTMPEVEISGH
jgi:hypothetical protein